jgi:hypothetical protein
MSSVDVDRTLNKIDVARTQLDAAIRAYGQGEHVIAITLAGAAEEIFGAMCARKGIQNAVERIAELPQLAVISDDLKVRVSYLNATRNCLKHARDPCEDYFVMADLDSFIMIVRALGNAKFLSVTFSDAMSNFGSDKF